MHLLRSLTYATLTFAACSQLRGANVVIRDGVELRRVDAVTMTRPHVPPGVAAEDFLLSAPGLRIAIAGPLRRGTGAFAPGAVFDLRVTGHDDPSATESVLPLVLAGGRALALEDPRFQTRLDAARPTLRLTATARAPNGAALRVQRDYALDPRHGALEIETRVMHEGGPPVRAVALGARLSWRAQPPFAPGVGVVQEPLRARAPWVAREAGGAVFAWTLLSGDLDLDFRPETHHGALLTGDTDALTEPRDLLPGRAVSSRGLLLARPGDLADAARDVARIRGQRVIETFVRASAADEPEGLFVTVTRPNGAPVLAVPLRARQARTVPLADGEYIAYAAAPGHTPADPVRFAARPNAAPVEMVLPPGGRIRFDARDDATGRALPVRVVVRGADGTADPALGASHEATGAGIMVIAPSGHGEILVPPGRYRLAFSHGPEWSVPVARTQVTATLRGDVAARLQHVVPMPDWTACDLHVHARPSFDSEVTVQDRVASLVAEGVEFAVPSEHNVVGNYGPGVAALPGASAPGASAPDAGASDDTGADASAARAPAPTTVTATTPAPAPATPVADPAVAVPRALTLAWVPAVEITTDQARTPVGHFNVYPYVPDPSREDGAPPPFLEGPRAAFRAARANNSDAIIQVNHPRMRPAIGYFDQTRLDPATNTSPSPLYDPGYDAIEIFNGYYLSAPAEVDAVLRDWFALLNSGARYIGTASSDSHSIAFHTAGYPRTYVYTPGAGDHAPSPATVLAALRAGHAFGTSGPMVFVRAGEAIPGDTVRTAETAIALEVRVAAAPWIAVNRVEVYRDGQRVADFEVQPTRTSLRFERTVSVPIDAPRSFVVVVARGQSPMDVVLPGIAAMPLAFTNPLWIERPRR